MVTLSLMKGQTLFFLDPHKRRMLGKPKQEVVLRDKLTASWSSIKSNLYTAVMKVGLSRFFRFPVD